ncbi:PLP-dependent aminotransferase family protein [bacterium]|nr:PLP-dependent aminotransferase family protein [bacterium]
MELDYQFSAVSDRLVKSEIREILKWTRKPGVISFGGGLPDASLFPVKDIARITNQVLEEKGYLALQYGPTHGEAEMLDALVDHMNAYDDPATTEEVCITSSSQQGIDLISMLFLDEGSVIVIEKPSYMGGIQTFRRCGADMRGVPIDEDGMDMNALREVLDKLEQEGKKPSFIYTIPDFQNPTGISMSLERRKELLQIARDRGLLIVEDSPYRELSFSGEVLPSIWKLSEGKGVIMLKTFSKMLFPGMRMGWILAHPELIEKFVTLKQSVDLCTPSFNQLIMATFLKEGRMKLAIENAIACYGPKRDAMLAAMEREMPGELWWSKPKGGMFLWVRLPENVDAKDIFMKAIKNNVAYVIGRPFHCDNSGSNTLRLNYSFPSIEQINEGIARLGKTIKEIMG